MDATLAGVLGAVAGGLFGYFNYWLMIRAVEPRLRAVDRSASEAEREDFERRIVILRRALLVIEAGFFAVVGWFTARWLLA
jgi:hypothetical protein